MSVGNSQMGGNDRAADKASSPWTEDQTSPSSAATVHWRSSAGSKYSTASELNEAYAAGSAQIYTFGFLGTVVAGGLFPILVALVVGIAEGRFSLGLTTALLVFAVVAFPVGCLIAGISALFVFPLAALVQALIRLNRHAIYFVSCAGGWSGFASVMAFLHTDFGQGQHMAGVAALAAGAMVMGQVGAGLFAWRYGHGQWVTPANSAARRQVRLTQLFGITTAVAVLMAILAALPIARPTHLAIATAAVVQATMVLAFAWRPTVDGDGI